MSTTQHTRNDAMPFCVFPSFDGPNLPPAYKSSKPPTTYGSGFFKIKTMAEAICKKQNNCQEQRVAKRGYDRVRQHESSLPVLRSCKNLLAPVVVVGLSIAVFALGSNLLNVH